MKRILSVDVLLLTISVLGFGFSFHFYVNGMAFFKSKYDHISSDTKNIATLTVKENTVRLKPAELPVWKTAFRNDLIFKKDSIFTDSDSKATVVFESGNILEVTENSLVVLGEEDNVTDLDLLKGRFLFAKIAKHGALLKVKINNTTSKINSKNATVQFSVNENGETDILVTKGTIELSNEKGSVAVAENQRTQINQNGFIENPETIKFNLLTPDHDARFYTDYRKRVDFSWEVFGGVVDIRFQLSKDPEFKRILFELPAQSSPITLRKFHIGRFYWRLKGNESASRESKTSEIRNISIFEDLAPNPILPKNNEVFQYIEQPANAKDGKSGPKITFQWEELPDVDSYHLEISKTKKFKESTTFSKTSTKTTVPLSRFLPGHYYWRVKAVSKLRPLSPVSEVYHFKVRIFSLLTKPLKLTPKNHVTLATRDKSLNVEFKWERVRGSSGYEFQLSKKADFKKLEHNEIVKHALVKANPQNLNSYYWRVKPRDLYRRKVAYSNTNSFSLGLESPLGLHPKPDQVFRSNLGEVKVKFSWDGGPLAKEYTFEMSPTLDFTNPVIQNKSHRAEFIWNGRGNAKTGGSSGPIGDYYWRVRSRPDSGEWSAYSSPLKFKVREGVSEKDYIPRLDRQSPDIENQMEIDLTPENETEGKDKSSWNLLDLLIPSAHARSKGLEAIIKWAPVSGAKRYKIQISKSRKFRKIIKRGKSKTAKYTWKGARPGKYYYRVASVMPNGKLSPYSAPGELLLRPPAPKLLTPKRNDTIGSGQEIDFKWSLIEKTKTYQVQIAQDKKFYDIDFSKETQENRLKISKLRGGTYYWRVKAVHRSGLSSKNSKVGKFQISIGKMLPAPDLKDPDDNQVFKPEDELFEGSVSWKSVRGANSYEVEISQSKDFSGFTLKQNTTRTEFRTKMIPGEYNWRVRAKSNADEPGHWSSARMFAVEGPERAENDKDRILIPTQVTGSGVGIAGGINLKKPGSSKNITLTYRMQLDFSKYFRVGVDGSLHFTNKGTGVTQGKIFFVMKYRKKNFVPYGGLSGSFNNITFNQGNPDASLETTSDVIGMGVNAGFNYIFMEAPLPISVWLDLSYDYVLSSPRQNMFGGLIGLMVHL